MVNRPFLLFFILIASCLNNLLIPYFIYYKKYGFFKKRPKDFVGVNAWGIVMDGLLAGLINIITFNFLFEIKPFISIQQILLAFAIGLLFTICCHIYMATTRWKIWIMPHPWEWNEAGYWHMISMTIQMSYSALCLVVLLANPKIFSHFITIFTLISSFTLSFLFLASLQLQHKGLKIGIVEIGNKPW